MIQPEAELMFCIRGPTDLTTSLDEALWLDPPAIIVMSARIWEKGGKGRDRRQDKSNTHGNVAH